MALFGAGEVAFEKFGGGLVVDTEAMEIAPDQCSDAENVDMDPESVSKRLGRVAYNTAPAADKVWGVHPYYPKSGARSLLMAAGSKVYADLNQDGDFIDVGEEIATLLTGGRWMDFLQYQDTVYFGNGVDAVRKWTGTGTSVVAANPVAPTVPPSLSPSQGQLEAFDSGTWTLVGSAISTSYPTDVQRDGTSLKMTATGAGARGSYIHKTWSAGATVDLSAMSEVIVWVYGEKLGVTYQIGVKNNAGTIDFGLFQTHVILAKKEWVAVRVSLSGIAPSNRTASTGLGIKFTDDGDAGFNVSLWFDDARGSGPLVPDDYRYYYTYAIADANSIITGESGVYTAVPAGETCPPKPVAGEITISPDQPVRGVSVTVTASAESGVNTIRIWRYRTNGQFPRPVLVAMLANSSATYLDTRSDGELAEENAEELQEYRIDPPLAKTYAVVNHRLIAGAVTISGTLKPWGVYVSRFSFPQQFSSIQEPGDAAAAGWFNLPIPDEIVRIIEFDGYAVILCRTSIWTLQGSGWDEFRLEQRANVGLSAREAVVAGDRLIYFLSEDGMRVLVPSGTIEGEFRTWVISEPVASLLRAIPAAYRQDACMGIDETGRIHLSYTPSGGTANSSALIFDPFAAGALQSGIQQKRPGWTLYSNWGFSVMRSLRRGASGTGYADNGQIIAGDLTSARIHYLRRSVLDAALETDSGSAIAWKWQSRVIDAGTGARLQWVYAGAHYTPQSGQTVTLTPILGRVAGTAVTQSLTAASGIDIPAPARMGPATLSQQAQLKISGSHSVAMSVRRAYAGLRTRR